MKLGTNLVSGVLAFAEALDRQDLAEIAKAAQEDCKRIDTSAW